MTAINKLRLYAGMALLVASLSFFAIASLAIHAFNPTEAVTFVYMIEAGALLGGGILCFMLGISVALNRNMLKAVSMMVSG